MNFLKNMIKSWKSATGILSQQNYKYLKDVSEYNEMQLNTSNSLRRLRFHHYSTILWHKTYI